MNIAIIGAGPAGIISARNAIKAGHSVVLFEKNTRIGGSGTHGVVALTVMPVCRTLVIHFIILAFPGDIDERSWMQMSDRVRLLGRGW
ncbi:FAD-dependent oxidoreductase [Escherichia coli]|nr:FAD-dependent oxidoreductase [Escherichia coli]